MKLRVLRPILFAAAMAMLAAVAFASHDLDSYDYFFTVSVDNQSGGALNDTPVAVTVHPSNLVSNAFLQADAEDWAPVDASETDLQGVAQGMSGNSQTWWIDVSQASGSLATYAFHTGNTTATRDQAFRVDGTTDTITATDHADLDITDELTMETEVNFVSVPSTLSWLVQKDRAYALGAQSGNTLVARMWVNTGASTENLRPNAAGDLAENTPNGCASNWECVDESSADDDTTYVESNVNPGTPWSDLYNLDATAIPSNAAITQLRVQYRARATNNGACDDDCQVLPLVKLSGTTVTGTGIAITTSYGNYAETMTRPGGGDWLVSDLDSLQAGVRLDPQFGGNATRVTQLFVVVTYVVPTDVTYSPIAADTDYTVMATYDGSTISLSLDGTEVASDTAASLLLASGADVVIGSSINGYLDTTRIGGTDISSPTYVLQYDFEPDEIAETQQGDSGSSGTCGASWVWTGTVEDVSAGGSDHDGTYCLTRDMSGITRFAGGIQSKAVSSASVTESTTNVVQTSITPVATQAPVQFFGREQLEGYLEHPDIGVTPLAAWFLFFTVLGLGGTFALWKATGEPLIAAIPWPGFYWVGFALGTPIPWWLPFLFTLVAFGLAFGLKGRSFA